MTKTETDKACDALQQWFISQDINPATAGIIMANLVAKQLVAKTTNIASLASGVQLFYYLLTSNVKEELSK